MFVLYCKLIKILNHNTIMGNLIFIVMNTIWNVSKTEFDNACLAQPKITKQLVLFNRASHIGRESTRQAKLQRNGYLQIAWSNIPLVRLQRALWFN